MKLQTRVKLRSSFSLLLSLRQDERDPRRQVDLQPVATPVEVLWVSEEAGGVVEQTETSESFVVRVQDNLVRSGSVNANEVVGKTLGRVKVEAEDNSSSLKHDDLVVLVFGRDVTLQDVDPPMTQAA